MKDAAGSTHAAEGPCPLRRSTRCGLWSTTSRLPSEPEVFCPGWFGQQRVRVWSTRERNAGSDPSVACCVPAVRRVPRYAYVHAAAASCVAAWRDREGRHRASTNERPVELSPRGRAPLGPAVTLKRSTGPLQAIPGSSFLIGARRTGLAGGWRSRSARRAWGIQAWKKIGSDWAWMLWIVKRTLVPAGRFVV